MMIFRKALLAGHKRLRRFAADVYHSKLHNNKQEQAVLFVLGCQRSGTTALSAAFEQDWNARVFPEFSELNAEPESRKKKRPRMPTNLTLRLRPLGEVALLIGRTHYPLVVCKPIVESQRAHELLESIENAHCLWMFRHYRDVADSIVRNWPDKIHIRNLEPIVREEAGNWRSELVPDDVRSVIARHYSAEMNPHDGGALFWYARNRLLLDLKLIGNPRVMMLQYEDFAVEPAAAFKRIYDFVGIRYPSADIARGINGATVGRGADIRLDEEIESYCEELWQELVSVYEARIPDKIPISDL